MDLLRIQMALFKVIRKTTETILATPSEQWSPGQVSSRLEILEGYWDRFHDNHGSLIIEDDEVQDSEYMIENYFSTCEDNYSKAKGRLYDEQARLTGPIMDDQTRSCPNITTITENSGWASTKLPPLDLPTFSGLQDDWEPFRDLFVSSIHENITLSDGQKLSYLKRQCKGEARNALEQLKITNQNYATAWAILKSRYDQPRILIRNHLKALIQIAPLKEESAVKLQALTDELVRRRSQLRSLGRPVEQWDDWFITLACEAMDPTTRRVWEKEIDDKRSSDSQNFKFPSFEVLERILQRQCRTLRAINGTDQKNSSTQITDKAQSGRKSVNAFVTTPAKNSNCSVCNENHYTGHCDKFKALNVTERREIIVKKELCFNCLKGGHQSRDCPSQSSCRECNGQHHTLIHEGFGKRKKSESKRIPAKVQRLQTMATTCQTNDSLPDNTEGTS